MKNIRSLKKVFNAVIFISLVLAYSCNSSPVKEMNKQKATSSTDSLINNPALTTDSVYQSGARMIAANDCLTCHKIDQKSIGPSYDSIALKYEMNQGNIENLAHKIIAGGYGRWGTVAMTPHPGLSEPDAQEMVKYILSLRKQ